MPEPILAPSESCPIRQRIDPETLATLDRMADREFMRPVIKYGDAWEVETTGGESFAVPEDLHPVPAFLPLAALPASAADEVAPDEDAASPEDGDTLERGAHPDADSILDALAQYTDEGCSGEVARATVRRRVYLARCSAPGYMDCTPWEIHETAQSAAESLAEGAE